MGEPPLLLACAVVFALREAVAAAREEEGVRGWFHLNAPATAASIRLACEDRYTQRVGRATRPQRQGGRPGNFHCGLSYI